MNHLTYAIKLPNKITVKLYSDLMKKANKQTNLTSITRGEIIATSFTSCLPNPVK